MAGTDKSQPPESTDAEKQQEKEEGEITPQKENKPDDLPAAAEKLPLEHAWSLWFDNPSARQKGQWGASLKKVYTFKTVEDFWCLYNNVAVPSALTPGADLCLFKDGVAPKWEDEKCKRGGKWSVNSRRAGIDTMWLHTLLAMIGEQFDDGEDICGAVVSVRVKGDRVALWTKTANDEALQCNIAKQMKEILGVTERIAFMAHEDAQKLDRKAKEIYFE